MSIPSPSAPATRRWRLLRPIRLSTFLLLVLVIALMVSLGLQRVRERQFRDAIAVYRRPLTEALLETIARPTSLHYQDGAKLDEFLKELRRATTGSPGTRAGIPIYVDPIGLQEAERSLNSTVRRPPSADSLPLGEHLRHVLDPLGLQYIAKVQDGYLIITSKVNLEDQSREVTSKDTRVEEPEPDPYLLYHDVLQ